MAQEAVVVQSWVPFWAAVIPLVASIGVYALSSRFPTLGKVVSFLVALLSLGAVATMYPLVKSGCIIEAGFPNLLPPLGMTFRVDSLGYLYASVIAGVWSLVVLYSTVYMKHSEHQPRFFAVLILNLGGCLGVALAGDWFTLFLFFEMISLAAYVLIIHEQTPEAMKAGFKYLVMSLSGSLMLFFAIIATYDLSGTLSLAHFGIMPEKTLLSFAIFVAFMIGFGIKAGMFPLHVWLPDAHPVAPSPASALLSGLMIKSGAYGIIRVFYNVYGAHFLQAGNWPLILTVLAVITMLLGSAVAILQDDLKRRLAYSSIGQIGYVLMGVSLLTRDGLEGSMFHIFGHALAKACLFLCVGIMTHTTGQKTLSGIRGIGRRLPITMGAFTMAALSMIGIPPFNGFVSKWMLSKGALESGQPLLVGVLMLCSMMACVYSLPIVITAFFAEPNDNDVHNSSDRKRGLEAPAAMLVPVVLLAAGSLVFSMVPSSLPFTLCDIWVKYLPVP